jgi:GNAT superfamily N-acetyltransferase
MSKTKPVNVTLRTATLEDIPCILELIQCHAEHENALHEVTATEEKLHETLFGSSSCAEVVLAELQGKIIGSMIFYPTYSSYLAQLGIFLEDLFVLPEYRGKGCGRQLLSYLAKLALERGCGRLEWAVLDWNTKAIDFYTSFDAFPMDGCTTFRCTGSALEKLAHLQENDSTSSS